MLRHVVLFRWTPTTTDEDIAQVVDGLAALPAAIAVIRNYSFGRDVGINDGRFDFAVVGDFDTRDDYLAYRDHPLHRALIDERVARHIAERAAVQFDITPPA